MNNSEKCYRKLFELAKEGILILEADTGKIIAINPSLSRMIGLSNEVCVGKCLWEIGPLKTFMPNKDAFDTLIAHGDFWSDDQLLESADAGPVAVEFSCTAYMLDHVKFVQCTFRDLTERKQAEKKLVENQAKYKAIFENVGVGIRLIGPDMRILEMNQQLRDGPLRVNLAENPICYRVLHGSPGETVCKDCPVVKTLQDGSVNELIKTVKFTDCEQIVRIKSSPIRNDEEVVAAIEIVEDITEKTKLEAQLQHAQKMESVGRLAGGVAHDYNNILSVILGYAELAMGKVNPSDPLYGHLNQILTAAQKSTAITRQLLGFARKQAIVPQVVDVNSIIENMVEMLRQIIGEHIELTWLPGKGRLWDIKIDPSQLEQILTNLCVNARDAISGTGKITIETHEASFGQSYCARNPGFVPGDFVQLAVSDDGCGVDKKTLDHIFEPFFTTKEAGRGTGLGLSTVFGIAEQNRGFIKVYSEPDQGTTFNIYLPRHLSAAETIPAEVVSKVPPGRGERVLLVEDNQAMREMSHEMLRKLGYQVLSAGTPGEALFLAEENLGQMELLITDVVMPKMNGLDLSRHIGRLFPDIPTLFISGYTGEVISQQQVEEGDIHFLAKPFSIKEIAVKVRSILDNNVGETAHVL